MPPDLAAVIDAFEEEPLPAAESTALDFDRVRKMIAKLAKGAATPKEVRKLVMVIATTEDELARQMLTKLLANQSGVEKQIIDRMIKAAAQPASTESHAPSEDELLREGAAVLEADDQLELARKHFASAGHAGETEAVELLHVALISRCLSRPINVFVYGDSASGKSHAVNLASDLHPASAYERRVGGSARSLVYTDRSFKHVHIIIEESQGLGVGGKDDGDCIQASIMRSLAWGEGLVYEVTEKNEAGKFVTRKITKEGPTGLITTGTRDLEPEMATRLLTATVSDSAEQTRAIVTAEAQKRAGLWCGSPNPEPFVAASTWLAEYGELDVVIPYAPAVASGLPCNNVRMRRDVQQIFKIVEALAFMHQRRRASDVQGRIIATLEDYASAHRLLSSVMAVTFDDVPDVVREAVDAVREINNGKAEPGATYDEIAAILGVSRVTASRRRVWPAVQRRFLANCEERKGHPARIIVTDTPPEKRAILPKPEEIAETLWRQDSPPGVSGRPTPNTTSLESSVYTPDSPLSDPCPGCPTPTETPSVAGDHLMSDPPGPDAACELTPDTPDTPRTSPCPTLNSLSNKDLNGGSDSRTRNPEEGPQYAPGSSFTTPEGKAALADYRRDAGTEEQVVP